MKSIAEYKRVLKNYGVLAESDIPAAENGYPDLSGEILYYTWLLRADESGTSHAISHGMGRTQKEAYSVLENKVYNRLWYKVKQIEEERERKNR